MEKFSDEEIEEMLKSTQAKDRIQGIGDTEKEKVMKFLSEYDTTSTPLKVLAGTEISLYGADVNLLSGFTLFTDSGNFSGTFVDNCSFALHAVLQDSVNKGVGMCYHNKDGEGRYFFVFSGIRMKIYLKGRIFRRYVFEVLT